MTTVFRSREAAAAVAAAYQRVLDGWLVPNSQTRLPTREGETFVVVCGPESAPPVVLLHGSQANSASWIFDAPLWSQSFRLYAIDMIGEAGFSAPSRPPLNGDAHALWLDDVLGGLGLAHAAFVGMSLGGWLSLDYANRRPGRVDQLALICPAGIGRQKNFLLMAAPLSLLGPWGARKVREMVFGPEPAELPAAVRPLTDLMALIGRSFKPRVVTIPRLTDDELARLGIPILVIAGGKDVLIDSVDTRDRLGRTVPQADVRFLPDARHFIPGQSDAVLQFLSRHA
jgi:pimeloyl-ACP methyl ester carboxylesterase